MKETLVSEIDEFGLTKPRPPFRPGVRLIHPATARALRQQGERISRLEADLAALQAYVEGLREEWDRAAIEATRKAG